MGQFVVDFWTQIFNVFLILMYSFYLALYYPILRQNFQTKHPNRWNALISLGGLLTLLLLTGLGIIDPDHFDPILVYPFNYYVVVFWGFWLMVCVLNNTIHEKIRLYKQTKGKISPPVPKKHYDNEWERKVIHSVTSLAAAAFFIAPLVLYWAIRSFYLPTPQYYPDTMFTNLLPLGDLTNFRTAAMLHYPAMILFFLSAITAQFDAELFYNRKPEYHYIFKNSFEKTRRPDEQGSVGSHVPMILGITLSMIIVTYNQDYGSNPFFVNATNAIVLVTVFGDMAASGVGRRWGKKKWPHNPKKSYLGTFSGCTATFLLTFWIVGIPLALLSVIIFFLADVVLPQWNLTDNFTYPFITAIFYRIFFSSITPLVIFVNLLPNSIF
jgi:dolichol kinase